MAKRKKSAVLEPTEVIGNANTWDEYVKVFHPTDNGGWWERVRNPHFKRAEPTPPASVAVVLQDKGIVAPGASMAHVSSMKADLPAMTIRISSVQKAYKACQPEDLVIINDDPVFEIGGIDIPDSAVARPTSGTIAMVGNKVTEVTSGAVNVNDRVIYAVYAGTAISFRGWNVRVMKHTEVLVVLHKEAEAFPREVVK